MSSGYICPFCNNGMSLHEKTLAKRYISFDRDRAQGDSTRGRIDETTLLVAFCKCPTCDKTSVQIDGIGSEFENIHTRLVPRSFAKQFPDYIPKTILDDYEEACCIIDLSPKASATLLRRCLQGMIRDFWGIKKSRLIDEVNELQDKIPAAQWKVIDSVRKIGNVGAHMEKDTSLVIDISSSEAKTLVRLIEHLLEQWYVARHNQEQLYLEIAKIDKEKQAKRDCP